MRKLLILAPLLLVGCMASTVTIDSEPRGLPVNVDGVRVGVTPVQAEIGYHPFKHSFIAEAWVGDRLIKRKVKRGLYWASPWPVVVLLKLDEEQTPDSKKP